MLKRWASNGISEIILPSRRSPNRQICWPCIFCLLNLARSDNEIRNGEINEHEICLNTLWSLNISSASRHILHISASYGSNINMNCKCFDVSLVKVLREDGVISKAVLIYVKTPCPRPQHANGQWSAQCNYNCYEVVLCSAPSVPQPTPIPWSFFNIWPGPWQWYATKWIIYQ